MILRILIVWMLVSVPAFGQGAGSVAVVPNVAALTNRPPSAINPVVSVSGYRTNGDWGPARTMRYVPTSTNAVDNGCVFPTSTGVGRWEASDCEGSEINVRWFGAGGNNDSDDTAEFQSAIDRLELPATNTLYSVRGGSVFVPKGTYKITAPLRMRPGEIRGESRFGTVLVNHGLTNDVIACMTPSNTPPTGIWLFRVAHMSIHQSDATVPTGGAAIRVQSDDGATASMADVENVFVHGTFRGFHGSALQGSSLKTLTVYATKDDGILWDVYQTMVQASGCWTYYCGQNGTGHGWHLQGPAYCTVSASGADSNYGWGWYIEPGTMQNPVGGTYAIGGEQNAKGGLYLKGARGGVYTPMLVTKAGNTPAADGIYVDACLSVMLAGGFTQQTGTGNIGYPLWVTNSVVGYPAVNVAGTYLNSYFDGTNYHRAVGDMITLTHEERGFLGLRTDGVPRRMLDIHDRTGAPGSASGHELARLALHTSDGEGNAYITLSPDGETSLFRFIANNFGTNTVYQYGTNSDLVFVGPGYSASGDGGGFLFVSGTTPVVSIKGGDTLGAVGIGTVRPNPAAIIDATSTNRGVLLPRIPTLHSLTNGLYTGGNYTPPGLLVFLESTDEAYLQTRNSTSNRWSRLMRLDEMFPYPGVAGREVARIDATTSDDAGSAVFALRHGSAAASEWEQNAGTSPPFRYGSFLDTIIRNAYAGTAGPYGNLSLLAGDNPSLVISNGTHRGWVGLKSNLWVYGGITLGGVARSTWPVGISDGDKGDVTVSGSGATWTIDADAVALGTDTTGNYVASVAGTANEVSASGSGEGAAVTVSLPTTIDLGAKTSFELPNAAAPTVDAFGEIAGDNDAWAAGRGAVVAYDGTAATRLVGVLSSDTPSNGQFPRWNTDGTITWENVPTVTNAPVTGLWQTLGFAEIIVENLGTDTSSVTYTNYSGIVTNLSQIGSGGSNHRLQLSMTFNESIGTNYLVIFDFDGADDTDSSYALAGWSQSSARSTSSCEVSIVNTDGFVYSNDGFKIRIRIVNPNATAGGSGGAGDVGTTADNILSGVNQFTNGLGQVFSVPPRVLGGRINGWTAPQMTPGTNASTQAQYKVLGDGIPSLEFDGATSEEISMVGLLSQDPDRGSFVTITFASDDTANTVCWQAQWQLLTLRGIDTNLLSAAATWTSNIPGTARVPTNITFSLNAPTGIVGGTNDFSKPYMLRITRLPGSDSSLSNAYLIGVDHRYGL